MFYAKNNHRRTGSLLRRFVVVVVSVFVAVVVVKTTFQLIHFSIELVEMLTTNLRRRSLYFRV